MKEKTVINTYGDDDWATPSKEEEIIKIKNKNMSFEATQNKGFRMNFENGFSISVQWGTMNYCEKKNLMAEYKDEMEKNIWESVNAEIAVTDPEGEMLAIGEHDTIIGWLSADEVAKIIQGVSSAESSDEIIREIKSLKI